MFCLSLAMHFPHFTKELVGVHVWRQTQTQSGVINFYEEDMNIFNPTKNDRGNESGIFRMEFPLMQWLTACLYKVFGNHLIITRIFMFVIGLLSTVGIYRLILTLFNKTSTAFIAAWAFTFSPGFYYYTINPLPDNLALCFSIWGIACFFIWIKNKTILNLLFSGIFMALGALCKLPFILYFIVPFTYFILEIRKFGFKKSNLQNTFLLFIPSIFPSLWYVWVMPGWHGNGIVNGMMKNDEPSSKLLDYLWHNLISTLPEILLNYGSLLFFITGFWFIYKNKSYKNPLFILFMIWGFMLLVYFFFEINMIAKVHDYYLFPFYPLLIILISYGAMNLLESKLKWTQAVCVLLIAILPFTAYLRRQNSWNYEVPGFNPDLLSHKNELRNAVPKDALCIAGNDDSHFIFFYYIDKKGWGFDHDILSASKLNEMIQKGAEYLYSDSRKIDENPEITPNLKKLVLQKGAIRVFELKNK